MKIDIVAFVLALLFVLAEPFLVIVGLNWLLGLEIAITWKTYFGATLLLGAISLSSRSSSK